MAQLQEQASSEAITQPHPSGDKALATPDIIDWTGPSDPENPFNWPRRRKLVILTLCLVATFSCNANSTAQTVAWKETDPFYGISDEHFPNSYWVITSWTLGGTFAVTLFLPLIEDLSIRWGYLAAYLLFIVLTLPQAWIRSYAGVNLLRFGAGGCVAVVANLLIGIICDVFVGEDNRNVPIACFITAYLGGIAAGPVIGAAILDRTADWRWIVWAQVLWHVAVLAVLALVLRETRGSIILRARAARLRRTTHRAVAAPQDLEKRSLRDMLTVSAKRPIHLFLTEVVVFSFTLWSSLAVGLVFLFTQSTELVFTDLYAWSSVQCGYVQAAVVLGMLLSLAANFYQKRLYLASAARNTEHPGVPIPEAALYTSVFGTAVGLLGGLFVCSWTAYADVPWLAPATGLAMVGFGINSICIAIGAYVSLCYSRYAVSAVAAVAGMENALSAVLPLATMAMYARLGIHWPSSLLGLLGLFLGMAPVVMLVWGRRIRARSPFIREARYEDAVGGGSGEAAGAEGPGDADAGGRV